jgi:mRNA deadenylase 3'-5' endonuclease subunit Ccr4
MASAEAASCAAAAAAALADAIAPPAIPRREVRLQTGLPGKDDDSNEHHQLRVLTWNVLADGLAQHGGWTHLPSPDAPALAWQQRFPRLLAEVAAARADIVCLQECNRFEDAWLPAMQRLGYEGRRWRKPRSPCERYGADADGLALFWRRGRLRLASDGGGSSSASSSPSFYFYAGAYRHLAPSPAALATVEEEEGGGGGVGEGGGGGGGGAAAPEEWLELQAASQGMIVAVLEEEEEQNPAPPRRLVVAVTHLKAKEGFEARRREQAEQLCARVKETLLAEEESGGGASSSTAVLVVGDFNAPPDSAAARLVREPASDGGLGLRCIWDVPLAGEEGGEGGSNGRKQQQQHQGEELLFTTWKFRDGGDQGPPREKLETIDHIFFGGGGGGGGIGQGEQSPPPLVPLARWAAPSRGEIGCAALPCESYPSDHVAVMCRFAWR